MSCFGEAALPCLSATLSHIVSSCQTLGQSCSVGMEQTGSPCCLTYNQSLMIDHRVGDSPTLAFSSLQLANILDSGKSSCWLQDDLLKALMFLTTAQPTRPAPIPPQHSHSAQSSPGPSVIRPLSQAESQKIASSWDPCRSPSLMVTESLLTHVRITVHYMPLSRDGTKSD